METLGRNSDNDLYLNPHGQLDVLKGADAQCARIEALLLTQQGELQFDDEAGIDYFGTILQSPTYLDFWAGMVKSKIEALEFVSSVEDFDYRFDGPTSTLYWSMTVINTDDERLDLKNKKMVLDGSPGIDVRWNDIYDKPSGTDEAIGIITNMQESAANVEPFPMPPDSDSTTLQDVKETINKLLLNPNDPALEAERQVSFTFNRLAIGTIIDVGNLIIRMAKRDDNKYYPCTVSSSDGATIKAVEEPVGSGIYKLTFRSEKVGYQHTINKKGDYTITINGHVEKILTLDETESAFRSYDGSPFPYLYKIAIGKLAPINEIGASAFKYSDNLREVIWNKSDATSVTIGNEAFLGCQSLGSISWIPSNISSIGERCFKDCTTLLSLKGLENTSITTLKEGCFSGCRALMSIEYLPDTITVLPDNAFFNCTSIDSIDVLPNGITEIGKNCFHGCTGITSILYPPESLTKISESAFEGCTSLKSLFIPYTVSSIGDRAFADCAILDNILSFATSIPSVGNEAFAGTSDTLTIFVDPSKINTYENDSWGNIPSYKKYGFYNFSYSGLSSGKASIMGAGTLKSDSIWVLSSRNDGGIISGEKEYRYENTVTEIPTLSVLKESDDSLNIELVGYIREISTSSEQSSPFLAVNSTGESNYLKELRFSYVPIEYIGPYTFFGCSGLYSIDIDLWEEHPYRLGDYCFAGCKSIENLSWIKTGIGKVVDESQSTEEETIYLPAFGDGCFKDSGIKEIDYTVEGITSFPDYCFAGSNLTTLTPRDEDGSQWSKLVSVGEHCFDGCAVLSSIDALRRTSVRFLPNYCFANCTGLQSIQGIENIISTEISYVNVDGEVDDEGHQILTPSRTTILGKNLFENCTSLLTIEPLANATFPMSEDWDANVPPYSTGIEDLSDYMFAGCTGLVSLRGITGKIHSLGVSCFEGCTGLDYEWDEDETIPQTYPLMSLSESLVVALPNRCFYGCTNIRNLIGLNNIVTIGDECFAECTSLKSTSGLGFELKSLGKSVFNGCTGLDYVTCLVDTPPSATDSTFDGIDTNSIPLYVRENNEEAYSSASGWSRFVSIEHRFVKFIVNSITEITEEQSQATQISARIRIDDNRYIPGVYIVEYGDGGRDSFIGDQTVNLLPHFYQSTPRNTTITLYGDVLEFGAVGQAQPSGANGHYIPSDGYGAIPFLGSAGQNIYSVDVQSTYIEKIYPFSFYGCSMMRTASIKMNEVGVVGAFAFANCTWLNDIPSFTVSTVEDCAFLGCSILYNVNSFSSVIHVGDYCFSGCVALNSIAGLTSALDIGDYAFGKDETYGLKACISISNTTGLTAANKIGVHAFDGCERLTSVTGLSATLEEIGDKAFSGCPINSISLSATIPPLIYETTFDENIVISQSTELFVPYSAVTDYKKEWPIIPSSSIWDGTRYNYWSQFSRLYTKSLVLRLFNIKAGEMFFGENGIVVSGSSWSISFGEGEQSIGFTGTSSLPTYTFQTTAAYKEITINGSFSEIKVPENSIYPIFYTLRNGESAARYPLIEIEGNSSLDLTSFGENAFTGFSNLQSIKNLPTVISIGDFCFSGCSLLSDVSGLTGVSSIGNSAFKNCTSLVGLKGLNSVQSIGESAFIGCSSLKTIDGLGLGVTSISAYAFSYCPLTEVQMLAIDPPQVADTAFSTIDKDTVPLYVLSRSISAYSGWSGFTNVSSRTIILTLNAVPENVIIESGDGGVTSNTFWAVDFSYENQNEPQIYGFADNGKFPTHNLDIQGADFRIRIEGGVTSIFGNIVRDDSGNIVEEDSTPFIITKLKVSEGQYQPQQYLTAIETTSSASLETIGDWSFYGCGKLSNLDVESVKNFGIYSFAGCSGIKELTGISGAEKIYEGSFYGTGLTNLSGLGADIKKIDAKAFGGLSKIEYIQIRAASAPELDVNAFEGSYDSDGNQIIIKTVDEEPYYDCSIMVYVPATSIPNYEATVAWKYFRELNGSQFISHISSRSILLTLSGVPSGTVFNPPSTSGGNVRASGVWTVDWGDGTIDVMSATDTTLPQHTYETGNTDQNQTFTVTIDGDIESIQGTGDYSTLGLNNIVPVIWTSDNNFSYLTEVRCSGDLDIITIGASSFANCSNLTTVSGFNQATTIGDAAFYNCTNLSSVGDFPSVTRIGKYAFGLCSKLAYVSCFPNVVTIDSYAFVDDIGISSLAGLGASSGETAGIGDKPKAWFGDYAFAGTGLGVIDSEYIVPPTIQSTTFANTIAKTIYVPVGSVSAYSKDLWWMDYLPNIYESCYIAFTFGNISYGTTVYASIGSKFSISSPSDGTWAIEWGDGTTDTFTGSIVVDDSDNKISHTYTKQLANKQAYIRFRGDFTEISASDSSENTDPILMALDPESYLAKVHFSSLKGLQNIGDNTFRGCTQLTEVKLTPPSSTVTNRTYLERIGNYAFYGCENLITVDLDHNNDAKVGENTCNLPNSLKYIGIYAFSDCKTIQKVNWDYLTTSAKASFIYPDNNEAFWFAGCTDLNTVVRFGNLTTIPGHTFFSCIRLRDVANGVSVLGNENSSTTTLGNYCFAQCKNIGTVNLPSGILDIGEGCFCCAPNFDTVEEYEYAKLPSIGDFIEVMQSQTGRSNWITQSPVGVENFSWADRQGTPQVHSVWYGAFSGCTRMTVSGKFPAIIRAYEGGNDNYYGVPAFAFLGCSSISDFTFLTPEGTNRLDIDSNNGGNVGRYAFAYSGIDNLANAAYVSMNFQTQTQSNRVLEEGMFMGCASLWSLEGLPDTFFTIKENCFNECTNLRSAYLSLNQSIIDSDIIPDEDKKIVLGDRCFSGCQNLSTVSSDYVDEIGQYCFSGCTSLTTISFPALTTLNQYCFNGCTGLTTFTGSLHVTEYPSYCFNGCTGLASVIIPDVLVTFDDNSFIGCNNIQDIKFQYTDSMMVAENNPFSGLSNKKNCILDVPYVLLDAYLNDSYWMQFNLNNTSGETLILSLTQKVKQGGGEYIFTGHIGGGTRYSINWGDGSETTTQNIDTAVRHSYSSSLAEQEVAIFIYCDKATSISGSVSTTETAAFRRNSENNGVLKACSPILYPTSQPSDKTVYYVSSDVSVVQTNSNYNPGLKQIRLYADLEIKKGAFSNSYNLDTISGCEHILSIGDCAFQNSGFNSIVFKDSNGSQSPANNVRTIGEFAFACSGIESFTFIRNSPITSFGKEAFAGSLITSISDIPYHGNANSGNGTAFQGDRHFLCCSALTSISGIGKFSNMIIMPVGMFDYCTSVTTLHDSNRQSLLPGLLRTVNGFQGTSIGSSQEDVTDGALTLPSSVIEIGSYCFSRCPLVSLLGLQSTITTIGIGAFQYTQIQTLKSFPISCPFIQARCFYSCNQLNFNDSTFQQDFPTHIIGIGSGAFGGYQRDINDLTFLKDCEYLESLSGFRASHLKSLAGIPDSVTTIGADAFRNVTWLTSLSGLENLSRLQEIGDSAFRGTNITNLDNLPSTIWVIGNSCFQDCKFLTDISGLGNLTLDDLTTLPQDCFNGCTTLKYIGKVDTTNNTVSGGLPANLLTIGNGCFRGCTSIETIIVNRYDTTADAETEYITRINDSTTDAFNYATLRDNLNFNIYVPSDGINVYKDNGSTWVDTDSSSGVEVENKFKKSNFYVKPTTP